MTLIPGDKVVSIQTASGPVLVQAGTPIVGDKGVSVQTATGPVFIPTKPLIPGDVVVSMETDAGQVLVPVISTITEEEFPTDAPGYTSQITGAGYTYVEGPHVDATHTTERGYRIWMYCAPTNACNAVLTITSPSFTGAWRYITLWYRVVTHIVSGTSVNYNATDLMVNGVVDTNIYTATYTSAESGYSTTWIPVELRRSEASCLDTDTCGFRFTCTLIKDQVAGYCIMEAHVADIVITY